MAFGRFGFTIISVMLLLVACGGQATVTEEPGLSEPETSDIEQITEQVVSQVVGDSQFDSAVIVFTLDEPLQPGDVIGAYQYDGYEPVPEQRTIDTPTWFFWVDRSPGGEFTHASTFVYVDATSGAISTSEEMWWPVVNGEGQWVKAADYWDIDNWAYANVDLRPLQYREQGRSSAKAVMLPILQAQADSSPGGAIVINGWEQGESGEENFAANSDQAYSNLNTDGFDVSYFGSANPNIPEAGNPDGIEGWFHDQGGQLGAGDSLVVYISGHGFDSETVGEANVGGIWEGDLARYLGQIDPSVNIVVIVQGCHSGAMIDGLIGVADITITATNATDPSYGDLDPDPSFIESSLFSAIEDTNPEDRGSEFSGGFWEDWAGVRADPTKQAQSRQQADSTGTGYWANVGGLSFVSGQELDVAHQLGWEFPQSVWGTAATRPTVLIDETDDGRSCADGSQLSPGQIPPGIDIGSAHAQWNEDGSNLDVQIIFSEVDSIDGNMLVSIEFNDPDHDQSDPSQNWVYDGTGNYNLFTIHSDDSVIPNVHVFDSDQGWQEDPTVFYDAEVVDNSFLLHIPAQFVPGGPFYISTTDGRFCDDAGLSPDDVPIRVISPFIPEDWFNLLDSSRSVAPAPAAPSVSPLVFGDDLDDTMVCGSNEPLLNAVSDITQATVSQDAKGTSMFGVNLADPRSADGTEFSFAVTVDFFDQDNHAVSAYIYQLHDNVILAGEIDPVTRLPKLGEATTEFGVHDVNGEAQGAFRLHIPGPALPTDPFISAFVQAFNMPTADAECARDELIIMLTPGITDDDS